MSGLKMSFADDCSWFDPGLALGFLMTGHGSINAYLYERRLVCTGVCSCGNGYEDWKHVLCECERYSDLRNLRDFGVIVLNGDVCVSDVLRNKKQYDRINVYAKKVFVRRRESVCSV